MKKKYFMISVCFLFIIFELLADDRNRTFRIGTVDNLPPFSFYENSHLKGIDIEVINELKKRLNLNIVIETLPWARVINELKNGDLDGAFSLYYVEERKSFIVYLSIMHYDNLGIMARIDNNITYNSVEDLYNKTIGKGSGVYINNEFIKAQENHQIIVEEINDTEMGNIKKLLAKRIDAVIGVAETMEYYAKILQQESKLVLVNNYIESNRPGYFVLSKYSDVSRDKEFMHSIIFEIDKIMTDGTYDRIKDMYRSFY